MSKTYVITGASRGIGLELTKQALRAGNTIYCGVRTPEKAKELNSLASESGGKLKILPLDVANDESVRSFTSALKIDHVDVLINNAGVYGEGDQNVASTSSRVISDTLNTNAIGPVRVTQALLPLLRKSKGARVANITSQMGSIADNGSGGSLAYRMSKTALNMFVKNLALEEKGMVALALHPGWVKTDMGGQGATLEAEDSAKGLLGIIEKAGASDSGKFMNYAGKELPW